MKRVLEEANYIIKTGKTIREIANEFKVSKSTVHKDLHERLLEIDAELYESVDKILKYSSQYSKLKIMKLYLIIL